MIRQGDPLNSAAVMMGNTAFFAPLAVGRVAACLKSYPVGAARATGVPPGAAAMFRKRSLPYSPTT
jgi:hypothetical protein